LRLRWRPKRRILMLAIPSSGFRNDLNRIVRRRLRPRHHQR
jgi:hypothetical protein